MRDPIDEALDRRDMALTEYENSCPMCDVCGLRLTADEYYYDIDGDIVCSDCLIDYMERFKQWIRH